jgi:hypothetical protein
VLSVYLLFIASLLSPFAAQGSPDLARLAKGAPVVAVGTIIEIGEPPGGWSWGGFVFSQKVKYRVSSVLKGEEVGGEITVYHYLFKDMPNSEKKRAALTPSLFAVGKEHILFVRPIKPDGGGTDTPSNTAVREFAEITSSQPAALATAENLKQVGKALSVRR